MVDAIAAADASDLFTDEERAVVVASVELTKTATLSDATYARVAGLFSERQLVELVVNTSIANLNNRLTDTFVADVEAEE